MVAVTEFMDGLHVIINNNCLQNAKSLTIFEDLWSKDKDKDKDL